MGHKQPGIGAARRLSAGMFVCALVWPARPATATNTDVLQLTGDKANRIDIAFIGDGYTAAELPTAYADHIDNVLDYMFDTGGNNAGITNPYARYQNFFNIYRVNLESNESGIHRRYEYPGGSLLETNDTALKSVLGAQIADRHLTVDPFRTISALSAGMADVGLALDDVDWNFTAVNTIHFGGSALFGVFTAGHPDGPDIALHEGAHWNHDLGDEYGGLAQNHPIGAPEANLDKQPSGGKWTRWLGYNDPQTGLVGVYPGGDGYDIGVYHPSPDSKMRSLNVAFDPIAREKIILDIYAQVDPIDTHLDNTPTYGLDDTLWIDVIDPQVILVQWLLDGVVVPGLTDESLDVADLTPWLTNGGHTVTARAYDAIIDHAFSDNADPDPLDLVRKDLDLLEQRVSFQIVPEPVATLFVLGLPALLRRRRA